MYLNIFSVQISLLILTIHQIKGYMIQKKKITAAHTTAKPDNPSNQEGELIRIGSCTADILNYLNIYLGEEVHGCCVGLLDRRTKNPRVTHAQGNFRPRFPAHLWTFG